MGTIIQNEIWVGTQPNHIKDIMQSTSIWKKAQYHWSLEKCKSKPTMRYHLTPVRMVIIKKSENRCQRSCGEKGTLTQCWWEYKLLIVQPLWKAVWQFLKELMGELPFNRAISLLGKHPQEYKLFHDKDTCTQMYIAALLTIERCEINLNAHQWQTG